MDNEELVKDMVKSVYSGKLHAINDDGLIIIGESTPIDFKSGDFNAVNRYFATKISSINADVVLSYDVLPRFWPKKLEGSLYLKGPQFIPDINYGSLRPDKITTFYGKNGGGIAEEPDYSSYEEQIAAKRNEQLFDTNMTKLSWANYARKWDTSFSGGLTIDAQNLKDLKGITNFLGDNCELGNLRIENFEGEVMDLTNFKFDRLDLVDCRFDSIKGMPEIMFSLTIKNASRYSTPFDNDIKQFGIKFPRIMRGDLIIYSEDDKHPEQSLFDFGEMTVLGDLCLKNNNSVGKITQSDVLADIVPPFKMRFASKSVVIINVNRGLDFSYNDKLNVELSGSFLSIRVENSKTPKCSDLKNNPINVVLKGISGSYLADDGLPYANTSLIFKDCSAAVINSFSAKCDVANPKDFYVVFIEGLPQNSDCTLDLSGFKDAGFISVDGYQFDNTQLPSIKKKLLIKYPQLSKSKLDKSSIANFTKMRTIIFDMFGQKPWKGRSEDKISEYATLLLKMKRYTANLKDLKPVVSVENFTDRFVDLTFNIEDIDISHFDASDVVWGNPIHILCDLASDTKAPDALSLFDNVFSNLKIPQEYRQQFENYIDQNEKWRNLALFTNVLRYVGTAYRFTGTMPADIEDLFDGAITPKLAGIIIESINTELRADWNWITHKDYATETLTCFKVALCNAAKRVLADIAVGGF